MFVASRQTSGASRFLDPLPSASFWRLNTGYVAAQKHARSEVDNVENLVNTTEVIKTIYFAFG
jgi:hypothetical protein